MFIIQLSHSLLVPQPHKGLVQNQSDLLQSCLMPEFRACIRSFQHLNKVLKPYKWPQRGFVSTKISGYSVIFIFPNYSSESPKEIIRWGFFLFVCLFGLIMGFSSVC